MRGDNAGMSRTRLRVAAYVIRDGSFPELLVFDHVGMPQAGTQVPAGGVRAGEDLESAVLREVAEETGLLAVAVVRKIAVEDKPHPDTGQPRRTSFFHLRAQADVPDAWQHHVQGDGDDSSLTFACRFLPLPMKRPLADDQDTWLGRHRPALDHRPGLTACQSPSPRCRLRQQTCDQPTSAGRSALAQIGRRCAPAPTSCRRDPCCSSAWWVTTLSGGETSHPDWRLGSTQPPLVPHASAASVSIEGSPLAAATS